MKKYLISCLILGGLSDTYAQESPSPMEALSFLEGSWAGEARIILGQNQEKTVRQTEEVTSRLNRTVLQVVGTGTDNGKVVFEALGILSYNKSTKKYNFKAYRENGLSSDAYVDLKGEQWFEWGFGLPNGGRMRYNTRVGADGRWIETGEYSADGTTWLKNFEMTLVKLK